MAALAAIARGVDRALCVYLEHCRRMDARDRQRRRERARRRR